jgi:hypothetical protein
MAQAAGLINHMHRSQLQSESQASNATPNRILASSLIDLLDEKKSTSHDALETLARKYDIDIQTLKNVSRFVNSPGSKNVLIGEHNVLTVSFITFSYNILLKHINEGSVGMTVELWIGLVFKLAWSELQGLIYRSLLTVSKVCRGRDV